MKALEQSQQVLRNEKTELTNKNAELQKQVQALETSNAQLAQAKEEKTELEREIVRLKSLEGMEAKSKIDLHNRRLASANQDLKRQNQKLEEENIALKERVDGLNEQLFTLQPQKPQ
ncbi:hypothetical protein ID0475_01220 [Helicobacter pylori]